MIDKRPNKKCLRNLITSVTYVGVGVGLLGGALGLAGGVGEREDDRPRIQLAHLAQDVCSERAADSCRACDIDN